jgi:hypothetical protein
MMGRAAEHVRVNNKNSFFIFVVYLCLTILLDQGQKKGPFTGPEKFASE